MKKSKDQKQRALTLNYTPLAGERLRPLGHVSTCGFTGVWHDLAIPTIAELCTFLQNAVRTCKFSLGKIRGIRSRSVFIPIYLQSVDNVACEVAL